MLDSPSLSFLTITASSVFLQWLLICQLLRSQDPQCEEHWLFLPPLCCVRVPVIQGVELSTLQVFTESQLQPHPRGHSPPLWPPENFSGARLVGTAGV